MRNSANANAEFGVRSSEFGMRSSDERTPQEFKRSEERLAGGSHACDRRESQCGIVLSQMRNSEFGVRNGADANAEFGMRSSE
ncbi:MAG: hypothetical protein IJZ04_00330 [Clostridia bacterium]|nr:hypothetical protein [Clostridia bacterium]